MTDITDLFSLGGGTSSWYSIAVYVLSIIAWWKIFEKAGEPGWKSLIPIYNLYVLYKLTWKGYLCFLMFFAILIGAIMVGVGAAMSSVTEMSGVIVILIGVVLIIAGIVVSLIQNFKFSAAFGHGVGYGLGLTFLNTVFILILAFDKSEYQEAH